MKRTNKKAQTEIVGLVIIVLIITVAMMFYLDFKTKPENQVKKTLYQEYAYNEIATSFAQSFLQTYVQDCDATIEELIVDCGSLRGRRIQCTNNLNSCEEVNKTLITIKNATLDEWNYPYGLVVNMSSNQVIKFIKYNCTVGTVGRGTPGVFLVPYYPDPGVGRVEIGICKS